MTALRSFVFMAWFVLLTIVMGIIFLPLLVGPRKAAAWMARQWAGATLWGLKIFCGTDMRVTGAVPRGGLLVASKHMSMWDTLALYVVLKDPAIVLKRGLLYVPFFGWYLWKATAIAIDRSAGANALRQMTRQGATALNDGRPILIFPEGTRKKPGAPPDYKPGVAGLYGIFKVPCVPAALNSGCYWQGFTKRPGTISLQFLEAIPPGLRRDAFMPVLQERIETATNALLKS
jgi:1-acyl-sn-glycerol-3-phosphate acyltransferase